MLQDGDIVGNYRLLCLLDQGRFSEVYLGEHRELGTQGAVKMLANAGTEQALIRFCEEAEALSTLIHPHIVRLLDFGIYQEHPFLVTSYAPGGTLRNYMTPGRHLDRRLLLLYVPQIASALQYAHDQGIVHCDIKPENLLLGEQGELCVGDFGLAIGRSSNQSSEQDTYVGTVAYIAPEQIQNSPCPASDQYALAVVVYEWLCGVPPFQGTLTEVVNAHLQVAPLLGMQIPRSIQPVLLKALAKSPTDRYPSIRAFAEALVGGFSFSQEESMPQKEQDRIPLARRSTFIGRERELEILDKALRDKAQARIGSSLLLISGELGIGKTRLAEEMARHASTLGWKVVWGRGHLLTQTIPYAAWAEILKELLRNGHILRVVEEMQALAEFASLLPDLQSHPFWTPKQLPLAPWEIWDAVARTLTILCESQPHLIILDDLHWVDEGSSLPLLRYLVQRLARVPILFVGTTRELDSSDPFSTWVYTLVKAQQLFSIPLGRLSDDQIRHLLLMIPDNLQGAILSRAAGNPFFAEAFAQNVGANVDKDAVPRVGDLSLPETVRDVMALRLRQLTSACRNMLSAAAVQGDTFSFEVLYLTLQHPDESIRSWLIEAVSAGLLSEEYQGNQLMYRFWHPLLARHLYEELLPDQRIFFHRQIAEFLLASDVSTNTRASTILYHLQQGQAEVGQIAFYAELAGDYASSLAAHRDAEMYYHMAVDLQMGAHLNKAAEQHADISFLVERLGECLKVQGRYREARACYEQVLSLRQTTSIGLAGGQPEAMSQLHQALVWSAIGETWYDAGDLDTALEYYQCTEDFLRSSGEITGYAWGWLALKRGSVEWRLGHYLEARLDILAALAEYERNEAAPLEKQLIRRNERSPLIQRVFGGWQSNIGRAYKILGGIEISLARMDAAREYLQQALDLFEQVASYTEIANTCCNLGHVLARQGEHLQAEEYLQRTLHLAQLSGDDPLIGVVFHNLAELAIRDGSLPEAEKWLRKALQSAHQIEDQVYLAVRYGALALLLATQAKMPEARSCLWLSFRLGHHLRNIPSLGVTYLSLAWIRCIQAQQDENTITLELHYYQRALHTLQYLQTLDGVDEETRTESKLVLAQVYLALAHLDLADQVSRDVILEAEMQGNIWIEVRGKLVLAQVLAKQQEIKGAQDLFKEVLQTCLECAMRLEYARALASYSLSALQEPLFQQDPEQVHASLREARELLQASGAQAEATHLERFNPC